jgi:hypothetical protein
MSIPSRKNNALTTTTNKKQNIQDIWQITNKKERKKIRTVQYIAGSSLRDCTKRDV